MANEETEIQFRIIDRFEKTIADKNDKIKQLEAMRKKEYDNYAEIIVEKNIQIKQLETEKENQIKLMIRLVTHCSKHDSVYGTRSSEHIASNREHWEYVAHQ